MSQSAECGAAVVPEWYSSLPKHYTVRVVAMRMPIYLRMETQRRRLAAEQRLRRGWTFAEVDCGDEVKELCELFHFLGPAPRREHVMS